MKYFILLLSIFSLISPLLPITWEIKQDGTGNFTTIGAGISAAQNGDTLLVYPGIYYENINYQGKNITITSLYDGELYDESYISATIIDGNHSGSVVTFENNETRNALLNGFTIQHGSGNQIGVNSYTDGGGIFIEHASPIISNCIIQNNYSFIGSGISLRWGGNPLLKGNVIKYNHSNYSGGVAGFGSSNMEFCTESLNSVYLNYGSMGCDITFVGENQSPVVIDTFTVLNPDKYFVYYNQALTNFSVTVNHGVIETYAADFFVHPEGNDNNSGLTPSEPLQTIAMAMRKIIPDELVQRTVHVAEGIYSPSLNNQLFPVSVRENIALIGAEKETTILDSELITNQISVISNVAIYDQPNRNFMIKNFTLINASAPLNITSNRGPIRFHYTAYYILENINITSSQGFYTTHWMIDSSNTSGDYILRNIHIYDNEGSRAISFGNSYTEYNLYAENIRIRNHRPGPYQESFSAIGVGMFLYSYSAYITEASRATIVNLEITDSLIDNVFPPWAIYPRGNLEIQGPGTVRIINATIGNNSSTNQTGGGITFGESITSVELINSIVYGNTPDNIALENDAVTEGSVYISNSLIQGGEEGVLYFSNPNTVLHWGEGNIDANPMWIGETDPDYDGGYPYMLHRNSPAVDAGTLDIPDFEFSLYDLAGNPRISGATIDMGAYEYQTISSDVDHNIDPGTPHNYNLHNYPNPVVELRGMGRGNGTGTNISFVLPKAGRVVIDIYNLKGQFVRRLIEAHIAEGDHNAFWNGKDEQERTVATGFYVYRLEIDGTTVATGRCTFIK